MRFTFVILAAVAIAPVLAPVMARSDIKVTPLDAAGQPLATGGASWTGKPGWFLREGYYALKLQILPPPGTPKSTPDTFEMTAASSRLRAGPQEFLAQKTDAAPILAVDPGCAKRGITVTPMAAAGGVAGTAPRLVGSFLYLAARCEDRAGQTAVLLSLSQDGPIEQSRFVPAVKVKQERNRLEALVGADAPRTWGVIALQGNRVQLGRATTAGNAAPETAARSGREARDPKVDPRSYSLWFSPNFAAVSFHQEPGNPDPLYLSHLMLMARLGASGRVADDKIDLSIEGFATALTLSSGSSNNTSILDYPAARYLGGVARVGYRLGSSVQFTPSLGALFNTMLVGANAAGTTGTYGLNFVLGAELRLAVTSALSSSDPRRPYHGAYVRFAPMLVGASIGPSNRDLGFGAFVQVSPRRWPVKLSLVADASLLSVSSGENKANWSIFSGGLQIGY